MVRQSAFTTAACAPLSLTGDTAGVESTCDASSAGGTTSRRLLLRRDAGPPTITAALARPPGSPVGIVTFACDDGGGSGIASCPDPQPAAPGTIVTGTAVDGAGNRTDAQLGIPLAVATAPAIVMPPAGACAASVQLDGSQSFDPTGPLASYTWTEADRR